MATTIGNPLSWTARNIGATSRHIASATEEIGSDVAADPPHVRRLSTTDIRAALRAGWEDFQANRSDAMFAAVFYPVIGLILFGVGMQLSLAPLLFPLLSGFALLGPVAAIGLYEVSRRRDMGEPASWRHAFGVLRSPALGSIIVLGLYLAGLFCLWIIAAHGIYMATLGPDLPTSLGGFLTEVLTTGAGWTMAIIGMAVGGAFALLVLAISVVSFPLLIDRHVGVPVAVVTSVRVFRRNPEVILTWGVVVAALLVLGAIPMLLGLIVTVPLLGHATWHLYRRAVD